MESLTKEWTLLLDCCLQNRVDASLFDAAVSQLSGKLPIPGRKLAALLLRPRTAGAASLDPRIVIYCERLLALKKIDAVDVLAAAFSHSRDRPPTDEQPPTRDDPSRWFNPPELEEVIFSRLSKAFHAGERPVSVAEGAQTLAIVSRWMSSMVSSHTSDSMIQAMAGFQQQPQQQSIIIREGLGMLVTALIENPKVLELLNREQAKNVRSTFAHSLSSFIPFLSQTSLPIAQRLELSQKEHALLDKSLGALDGTAGDAPSLEMATFQLDSVLELPVINTRAGLYIFLNASLVGRPLLDDLAIISYLHARYKTDAQAMVTDLIISAFDILANAMYRGETGQTMFSLKCFLVNRLPLLLTQLMPTIPPIYALSAEMCITQALARIDPNAFPSFSQGFGDMMGTNSALADVRQDFLNACALHGLVAVSSIERLLGEAPLQGPPATRYKKADLLSQYKANFLTVNTHIDELEALNGNTGAIAQAITEFISHLCETQMTMYLKIMCNALSKRPHALDAMLHFSSPSSILQPLCRFLDEWRNEDAQAEYQSVYDEFGAILVLILAFVYRFELTFQDIGISHDSFVTQLLQRGGESLQPEALAEAQGKHLGCWLRGLFDSDKEALANDVFASCRPQEFYLIVPTLFSQAVQACSADVLSLETVKGGLEFLQNTSLLPSLVGGLTWMASYALKQPNKELDILMQLFQKLIRSAPTSGDAHVMHSTILCIVSRPLEQCFHTLKRRYPTRTDIDPLLEAIKGNLHYERSVYPLMAELNQWVKASGTLNALLQHIVQNLSQWASTGALQPTPPTYTHKQLYECMQGLGVSKTLRTIIEEIKNSSATNYASALDVGVSLICAPAVENSPLPATTASPARSRTHMNLREMLHSEFENTAILVRTDHISAETTVRLHRRVEAQMLAYSQASVSTAQIDLPTVEQDVELNKALNDAAATMAAAGANMQPAEQDLQRSLDQHLDLSGGAGGLDLGGMGVGAASGDMGALPNLDLGDLNMDLGDDDDGWGLDFDNM